MTIKSGDTEINFSVEELRHFKIDNIDDLTKYLSKLEPEVKKIGFDSNRNE